MLQHLAFLGLFSVILLLNNGIGEATLPERFSWNPNKTVIVDRTIKEHMSTGFYILGVDRTTFSVDRPVWLQQFDIVKVFGYDPVKEIPVHRVPVKLKIRKLPEGDFTDKNSIETVFTGHAVLNSTHEATVNVFSKVLLKPGFVYEIRMKMPERVHYMYTDYLDIHEHKITRFFGKSIIVHFHQHNPTARPLSIKDSNRKVSHGLVKRLHVKYSWF